MINELKIKNFLTFKALDIPELKKVNLIAGKNNAGKTALLEALRIVAAEGDETVINNILKQRGLFREGWNESYLSLFNQDTDQGEMEMEMAWRFTFSQGKITILGYGSNIDNGKSFRVEGSNPEKNKPLSASTTPDNPRDVAVYVPFRSDFMTLSKLWDNIVLTPEEDDVLKIIRDAVEPRLVRLDVGTDQVRIRLKDAKQPVPLKTLGDGVERILLIALSLANAKGKCLLVDEIELGLHYSVMEKLWEIIFHYAKLWKIQVFITTHSHDALKAFQYVAATEDNANRAAFIRLQIDRNGNNEAVVYDGERLANSQDLSIEIR